MTTNPIALFRRGAVTSAILIGLSLTAGCPTNGNGGGNENVNGNANDNDNDNGTEPTDPAIGLSKTSLFFSAEELGANPADQTVVLSNSGAGTLNWTVSDEADWLIVTPSTGSLTTETQVLSVSIDTAGLAAANSPHNAAITVAATGASNNPVLISVLLNVIPLSCDEVFSGSITSSATVAAGCYVVDRDISIGGDVTLTLEPGVTLRFRSGTGMTAWSDGRLTADGTAEAPIVLTAATQVRGFWDGVRLFQTNSIDNILNHVTIEYGGSGAGANLIIDGSSASPARVSITNCTIRQSEGYGVRMDGDAIITAFTDNTITGNALGAGDVDPASAGFLDNSSTYSGNDVDIVRVRRGSVDTDVTWQAIDADYFFAGDPAIHATLTIAPGARLVFEQSVGMTVWSDGRLTAIGTLTQPIVLTGEEQTRGFWDGLRFFQTSSASNQLSYVTVEYGGGGYDANLVINGSSSAPSRVSVDNCTFRQSADYGFYFDGDIVVVSFSGNTSTANALGAGNVAGTAAGFLDDTGTYTGNDIDVVLVRSDNIDTDQTWPGIDADYLITGDQNVHAFLTIAAGARLVFQPLTDMTVWSDGQLSAVGTETQPIVFTGKEAFAGSWDGLQYFQTVSANNRLDYVTIEYGGGAFDGNLVINASSTAPTTLNVTNSTFQRSNSYGIWIAADANVNADIETSNTFANNVSGAVFRQP